MPDRVRIHSATSRRGAAERLFAAVFGAAALSWPLAWNGFPLVYFDTAGYLLRFGTGQPSLDRPILYSAIMWLARSMPGGFSSLAFLQAAITSVLLLMVVEVAVPRLQIVAFLSILLVVCASPTVFHVATLMPDVATLWMCFALVLLALVHGRAKIVIALSVIGLALLVHHSNFVIFALTTPILLLARPRLQTVGWIAIATATFFSGLMIQNVSVNAPPLTSATTFFLAGRLNQTDALRSSLAAQGTARHRKWAEAVETLGREPEPFLWSEASPLRKEYPEWDGDVRQFSSAQRFLQPVVEYGLRHDRDAIVQSGLHNVGSLVAGEYLLLGYIAHPATNQSLVWRALMRASPSEAHFYAGSRQVRGELPSSEFPTATRIWRSLSNYGSRFMVLLGTGSVILLLVRYRVVQRPALVSVAILTTTFIANVLVCGFLSSPQTRYIERVYGLIIAASVITFWNIGLELRRNR